MRHNRALSLYDESNKLVNNIVADRGIHGSPGDTSSNDDLRTIELSPFSAVDANDQAQYLVHVCDWLDRTIRKNNSREVHKHQNLCFSIRKKKRSHFFVSYLAVTDLVGGVLSE